MWAGSRAFIRLNLRRPTRDKLSFEFDATRTAAALNVTPFSNAQVGTTVLPDLTAAMVTQVSSTTTDLDAGSSPGTGGGIEVR
jgi:hypothetical protein